MTIEINDRLYNEFTAWAKVNNMSDDDMAKYIEKAFRDKFNLDKYGDLNEKLRKEEIRELKDEQKNKPIPGIETDEQISERINEQINGQINDDVKTEKHSKRKTKVLVSK